MSQGHEHAMIGMIFRALHTWIKAYGRSSQLFWIRQYPLTCSESGLFCWIINCERKEERNWSHVPLWEISRSNPVRNMNHLQEFFCLPYRRPWNFWKRNCRQKVGKTMPAMHGLEIQKSFIVVLVLVFLSLAGTIWERVAANRMLKKLIQNGWETFTNNLACAIVTFPIGKKISETAIERKEWTPEFSRSNQIAAIAFGHRSALKWMKICHENPIDSIFPILLPWETRIYTNEGAVWTIERSTRCTII